jgi:hypothetical protein
VENASFRPAKLSREALEVPLPGRLARVAPEEARRFHGKALALRRRLSAFGPRFRRRLERGALCGAIVCAIGGWLLVASSWGALLAFLLLGAVAGALVATLGLGLFLGGLVFGAVGLVVSLSAFGPTALLRPPGVAKVVFMTLLGAVFAVGEALWRSDGD